MNKLAFDRLFENHASTINDALHTGDSLKVYSHCPQRAHLSPGVSTLATDSTSGNLLLSGSYDGSVSLWSLDGKVQDNSLVNKRLEYITRKAHDGTAQNTTHIKSLRPSLHKRQKTQDPRAVRHAARHAGPRAASSPVHACETRAYKYRMYRQSSSPQSNPLGSTPGTARASPASHLEQAGEPPEEDPHRAHTYGITCLAWYGPDNGIFLTGSNDHAVKLWDTASFEAVKCYNFDTRVNDLHSTSAAQSLIAVATDDYYPRVIDLRQSAADEAGAMQLGAKSLMRDPMLCARFHPTNGQLLATGDAGGNCKLWDLRMVGKPWGNMASMRPGNPGVTVANSGLGSASNSKAHLRSCNALTWSPGGSELVTMGTDGRIYCWSPFQLNAESIVDVSGTATADRQIGPIDLEYTGCRTIGGSTIDPSRNKEQHKYRTSQRLEWFDNYLLVNTDYAEIQIYEIDTGKYLDKIRYDYENDLQHTKSKLVKTIKRNKKLIGGMCLQKFIHNGVGLRLYLGTNDGYVVEMS